MATYNKRGHKPKGKEQGRQLNGKHSTTAEVFDTLDQTANKSEKWIEKNSKVLFYVLIGVAVAIIGYLAYLKYVVKPAEKEATNKLSYPRKYFNQAIASTDKAVDSLFTLGLEGADGKYGFIDIATNYSGTDSGNLANYYAGISYLKMKKYKKAIDYLSKFSSDDKMLGSVALGAIGDAFSDINQPKDALEYYLKATKKKNNFTTPLFLFKAANIAMDMKQYKKAEKLFVIIKEKYPKAEQAKTIEKYINSAKYADY